MEDYTHEANKVKTWMDEQIKDAVSSHVECIKEQNEEIKKLRDLCGTAHSLINDKTIKLNKIPLWIRRIFKAV